jgi:hypothetical protein
MNKIGKITGINLLILVLYVIICGFSKDIGSLMVLIALHFLLCITIGVIFFFLKDSSKSNSFILSAFLVLLIGFSSCSAIAFY